MTAAAIAAGLPSSVRLVVLSRARGSGMQIALACADYVVERLQRSNAAVCQVVLPGVVDNSMLAAAFPAVSRSQSRLCPGFRRRLSSTSGNFWTLAFKQKLSIKSGLLNPAPSRIELLSRICSQERISSHHCTGRQGLLQREGKQSARAKVSTSSARQPPKKPRASTASVHTAVVDAR